MKNNEQQYATRKFNILKSAQNFKEKVGSNFDIKTYKDGKFGVRFKIDKTRQKVYTKPIKNKVDDYDPSDFDSDINGNGTNWHTAEDL